MRTLLIDTRQKAGKHELKHSYFESLGLPTASLALDTGDYMFLGGNVRVDTKQNIQELYQDLCTKDHARFRRECQRAQEDGNQLIILVETYHVATLEELAKWRESNNEYYRRGGRKAYNQKAAAYNKAAAAKKGVPQRIYGKRLAATCQTMTEKYSVLFDFCKPEDAGARVIKLLETFESKNEELKHGKQETDSFDIWRGIASI